MGQRLETAATISVIVVCGLAAANLVWQRVERRHAAVASAAIDYKVGDAVRPVAGLTFGGVDRTVLLVLRTSCPYCTTSMEFYRALQSTVSRAGADTRIRSQMCAISPDPEDVTRTYLEKNGLHLNSVSRVSLAALGVRGTPTLLVVDREGRVRGSWVGKLNSNQEKEVIQEMSRP